MIKLKILFQKGFSLLEIVIVLGLMSMGGVMVMRMLDSYQKEMKHLQEKMASMEVQRVLSDSLRSGICSFELTNPTPKVVNLSNLLTATIALQGIHTNSNPSSTFLIEQGKNTSSMVSNLILQKLEVKNFKSTGVADSYLAELTVTFENKKLVRPIKPIAFQLRIYTDPATAISAKKITGCSNTQLVSTNQIFMCGYNNAGGSGTCAGTTSFKCITPNPVTGTCTCPTGLSPVRISRGAYYYYAAWDSAYDSYDCR